MIRCNNCMEEFENEEELSQIVEQTELYDGVWQATDRFIYDPEMDLEETEDKQYEIFRGCPYCLDDKWLMDLKPYEKEKVIEMFHYRKALKSIMKVKSKVDSWSGTVEELYEKLSGFNYDDHGTEVVFDCYPDENEEVVLTLMKPVNEPIKVIISGIEVWDDTMDSYHSLSISELREYAEKENAK